MSKYSSIYLESQSAFEQWCLIPAKQRFQVLEELKPALPDDLLNSYQYQLSYGHKIVDSVQSLVSPTGETNELYVQGRGVSVLLVEGSMEALLATTAILSSLLITGNSVIVCTDDKKLISLINKLNVSGSLPKNLIQRCESEDYSALLSEDIRNFAIVGNAESIISVNRELAAKPNAITSLVTETDLKAYPVSQDTMLALRFVTERVRTINITAIGGNAMLLELGSDHH